MPPFIIFVAIFVFVSYTNVKFVSTMFCLTSFCCVCLNECDILKNLDNNDDDEIQLFHKLKYCAFENVSMEHNPLFICSKCLQTLKLAYDFKKTCRKSNEFIKKYISELSKHTKATETKQNNLQVELVDIKECVLFTNMAHTYANCNYDKKLEKIEEIFIKNEPINKVTFDILDINQIQEFPQLVFDQIKQESFDFEINNVEYEIIDLKSQSFEEYSIETWTGFSTEEIEKSKNYFNKLNKNLNPVLKKTVLSNNFKSKKEETKKFKCPYCKTSFIDCFLFDKHVKQRSCERSKKITSKTKKKFCCNICSKKFLWKGSLKHHMVIHTGVKEHVCQICEKAFTQRSSLLRHLTIHNHDGVHKCKICNKSFYSHANLKTHMNHHQEIRSFSCDVCDKNFFQRGHLTVHMLIHNKNKKFNCEVCNKQFNYNANYKEHLETHFKPDNYKCPECSKSFSLKASFTRHVKGHLGVRNYLCDVCSQSFINKSHLDRHMLCHTGEFIHKCYLCPKKFVSNTSLLTHIKTHFRETNLKLETCDICQKSFKDAEALKRHKMIHRERKRKHNCLFCVKSFYNKMNLKNHLITHTGQRKFKCIKCPKTYKYLVDYNRHLGTHDGKKTK